MFFQLFSALNSLNVFINDYINRTFLMLSRFEGKRTGSYIRPSWAAVIAAHWLLISLSFVLTAKFLASLGRFNTWPADPREVFAILTVAQAAALLLFGIYRRSFRYAGLRDLLALAKSVAWSALVASAIQLSAHDLHFLNSPDFAFVLVNSTMLFLLLAVFQFSVRVADALRHRNALPKKRALIVGAGDGGASVARELLMDPRAGIKPLAFVDDDPEKHGNQIFGIPILGSIENLTRFASTTKASEILVCIPSADSSQMSRILGACRRCGIPVRTLPSVSELLNGEVSWRDLRSIHVEDVLQREAIQLDKTLVESLIRNKVVLVTGAGGSIGSELCRQIAAAGPRKLILVDKSENSLFYSHLDLGERFPNVQTHPYLVDVTSSESVGDVFRREQPQIVFHAAAFKHVGMMELHPHEAIRNNLLGTRNVAAAAADFGVTHFVNISTDKAVNPSNYMGLSKHMAERTVREMALRRNLRFMNVRFGNVAGSTGSVVRLFSEQIAKGGPLRVTDPRATRYFMSIPEAVYLILCAAALGEGGETFIFDMGEPINIYQLARTMSLLSGFVPEEEVRIEFIGLREGEKIHEELREDWEEMHATAHPRLFTVTPQMAVRGDMARMILRIEEILERRDYQSLLEYINACFPRFAAGRVAIHEMEEYQSLNQIAGVA
jgi:FlaA1/EpsC-like NDP-sugar epimerase